MVERFCINVVAQGLRVRSKCKVYYIRDFFGLKAVFLGLPKGIIIVSEVARFDIIIAKIQVGFNQLALRCPDNNRGT
jgi:hypothetical protein